MKRWRKLISVLAIIAVLTTLAVFPPVSVLAAPIDVGDAAISRAAPADNGNTLILTGNPANDTGTITQIDVYCTETSEGAGIIKFGIFRNTGGDNFTCITTSGNVTKATSAGANSFTGLSLAIQTGDYIGIFYDADSSFYVSQDTSGGAGVWWKAGDQMACVNTTFGVIAGWAESVYGIGATGASAPTITLSATTLITQTTARVNGNITATGGENPTVTVYWGDDDGGDTTSWDFSSAPTSPAQPQGVAAFYKDIGSLSAGTTYYFNARAVNSGGTTWAGSENFKTGGSVYYVKTTGNNGNTGLGMTDGTAWLTFQHAADTAVAGDTVNFLTGTYSSTYVSITNSGSAGNYITFQNYAGATALISITDANYLAIDTNIQSYLKFIGLHITAPLNYYGIDAHEGSYITFQDLYVYDCKGPGIYAEDMTNLLIDSCEVYDVCSAASEEQISLYNVTGFEIKNCVVHDPASTQRIGIDMKDGTNTGSCHDNVVYNITGWGQTGIYVDARGAAHDIDIYNNLVYNNPNGQGIAVGDEGGTGSLADINIYNNVIYNCENAFMLFQTGTETFENIYFVNNTCYDNSSVWTPEAWVHCAPADMTNCIIRNNIFYSITNNACPIYDPDDCYGGGKLLADHNLWYNSGGAFFTDATNIYGGDYVTGNPLLVAVGSNFHIQSGSPAKDAGDDTDAPADDYDGISRPFNVLFDIGAYEYYSSLFPMAGAGTGLGL